MAYGQPSNTTNFNPFSSDFVLDALERCGIYAPEGKHLQSARRSFNLLMASRWSNLGINLWKMQEIVIPLIPGVINYFLNKNVVSVYDCYRRQYPMNGAASYPVAFTTQIGSPNVTIAIPGNSSPVGSYIGVGIPVSVGGLILYGFYQVIETPTANSVTVVADANATGAVTGGGAVPIFTSAMGSQNISVLLPNHGLVPGVSFPVNVAITVGNVTLSGNYIVQSVTDANHFVILASSNALSGQTVAENGAKALISTQNLLAGYTDILMTQFSRNDYAAMADKTAPGAPTTLWVNKQIIPEFSVWPVTDNTGPYEIHLWCQLQIQDVNPTGGQVMDLVQRAYYACVLDLARDLAMKFAVPRYAALKAEAAQAWMEAEGSDVEPVSTWILPLLPSGLG